MELHRLGRATQAVRAPHQGPSWAAITLVLLGVSLAGCGSGATPAPSHTPGRASPSAVAPTEVTSPTPSPSPTQAPGTFTITKGSFLDTLAYGQTAALLGDGRVLIAGGETSLGEVKTGEIYDPTTDTFSLTGSLIDWIQSYATSVLLRDGRVMILLDESDNAAELYDPASGTFSKSAPMPRRVDGETVTVLPDSQVLVAGGCCDKKSLPIASAELYNPTTNSWTSTATLHYARNGATATLLSDGRVLVAGGFTNTNINKAGEVLSSAEIYDPSTGRWSDTGSMNGRRGAAAAALLQNGKVVVAGGEGPNDLSSAELYDPATGKWAKTGSLSVNMIDESHTFVAVPLLDGRVLMTGGSIPNGRTDVYDPTRGTFSEAFDSGSFSSPVRLHDGRVLMIGFPDGGSGIKVAVLYQP